MKKYIGIDSVDDIDLGKISIANINDRYIDNKGNRFATRFNLRTKKIQIVRIALGEDEAKKAKGKVVQSLVAKKIPVSAKNPEKVQESSKTAEAAETEDIQAPDLSELGEIPAATAKAAEQKGGSTTRKPVPEWIITEGIAAADKVHIGDFLAVLDENYKLLAERLFGVINNIKNSGVMEKVAEIDDAIDFTNLYDHNIHPKMEETKKMISEFEKYAERPEHYFTMIEKHFRLHLQNQPESEIMNFLKAYFIGFSALGVLEETNKFIHAVEEKTKAADTSNLDAAKMQFLEYAYSTCEFLRTYVKEDAAKILCWMKEEQILY
ncbi:MAG: hypothetical protein OEV66_10670 [Spirochaetia bacterium]|nr:hypothetical protein [Spirochaetia bacterium]